MPQALLGAAVVVARQHLVFMAGFMLGIDVVPVFTTAPESMQPSISSSTPMKKA